MLSKKIEQNLVELFIIISNGEEKINKLKQNILNNYNLNPIKIFFKLDNNKDGYISKSDISSFLKFFSVNYTQTDIDYIFYFYDKDNDNALSFYEFLDLIISDSNYLYKKSFKKKYKHNKFDNDLRGELDRNAEKNVLEILIQEISLARQLNNLILNLKQFNEFSIQDIFYEIKSYSYITNDSLKAFFDRNEINYNDKFIKNIFNRFENKEINGKISFNKFKSFFDLPYNKNLNLRNNNNIIDNSIPKSINQTYISDIKFNNSNTYTNYGYSTYNQPNVINYNNMQNFCNINNDNYINEEDIQFECSHLSRSGSIESNKDKDINCKYISKNNNNNNNNNRNNLYKNYLREKRSKSLEKSFSKSLSRASEPISRTEKRNNIFDKKNNSIRNIKPIVDNYNDFNNISFNNENNISNSGSSFHEDIPVKYPIRLDKKLVQRPLPQRKDNSKHKYNYCYDNHYEDLNINNKINNNIQNEEYYPINNKHHHHHHHHRHHSSDLYNNQNMINVENEMEVPYNLENRLYQEENEDERFSLNNLDLKIYQEDINTKYNNGRY